MRISSSKGCSKGENKPTSRCDNYTIGIYHLEEMDTLDRYLHIFFLHLFECLFAFLYTKPLQKRSLI